MLEGFPTWLIITAVVLIIIVLLFRTMNQVYIMSLVKKNFFYIILIGVLIFVTVSLVNLHRVNDLSLVNFTTLKGLQGVLKVYANWLVGVFSNMGKVVGYAFQQDWITNSTAGG